MQESKVFVLSKLLDDERVYEEIRKIRWPEEIECHYTLLRSWLLPHRGISQEKLPLYLSFFEFTHNARKRGKGLLPSLLELLFF